MLRGKKPGQGGTTTLIYNTKEQRLERHFLSLAGTTRNCAGGPTPWNSWITCEETVNGPDVGPDFTGVSNVPLQQRHGFIFEVPAGGQSNGQPITAAVADWLARPLGSRARVADRRPALEMTAS